MFSIRRPSEGRIVRFLHEKRNAAFVHPEVGATRGWPPRGYDHDTERVLLGRGEEVFQRAMRAVREWRMFPREMAQVFWPQKSIEPGAVVAVLFRGAGVWSLNACRVVYTFDEECGEGRRFGFAYGALEGHVECGEERFQVEHRKADDSVWYELYCFSRPNHWLARLAYPYVRSQQRWFRTLSAAAMRQAVTEHAECEAVIA